MLNVLIHQETIPHYREQIFNMLAEKVNLTVVYEKGPVSQNVRYRTVKVRRYKIPKMGYLHSAVFMRLVRRADVLISMLTFEYIDINKMRFWAPNTKSICWGIGVAAAYNIAYDSVDMANRFMQKINTCDAALFYSVYPREKYRKLGISPEKMFVADNTVYVEADIPGKTFDSLLFVGSLYKQKRVDRLIEQYKLAYNENKAIPDLIIIGNGDERTELEQMTLKEGLGEKVRFCGVITDEKQLKSYFASAAACISPDQAGLSVLKSMGYGVPFITHKGAVTGGEIFNIVNGVNGILFDDFADLKNIILRITEDKKYMKDMSTEAYAHYWNKRRPEMMVEGFVDAIQYVTECGNESF